MNWWDHFPGRLQFELQALAAAGISHSLRQADFEAGRVVLDLQFDATRYGGPADLRLEVRVPDTFPYFRPIVIAPQLMLDHHQHPFDHNLCLLGRRIDEWGPGHTIAWLVTEQLEKIFRTNAPDPPQNLTSLEEAQAEPISAYYQYEANSICFVDGGWVLPLDDHGTAEITMASQGDRLRVEILRLLDSARGAIAESAVTTPSSSSSLFEARWYRLTAAPKSQDAEGVLAALYQQHPARSLRIRHGLDVVLVAYPEEIEHRTLGAGWLLLVREPFKSKGRFRNPKVRLIRTTRAGTVDMAARIAEWPAMRNVRVALFGVGCIGAPIALELARAGIKELWLIDHDVLDAGVTVRWPIGISAVGRRKVDALKIFINQNYPHTGVAAVPMMLGALGPDEGVTQAQILTEICANVDVIVDATAEYGVQYFLSDLAMRADLPYVSAHGTHGGYGGEIVSLRKGATGCWMCLRWARQDGAIPEPPALTADWIQPQGCDARTFLGSSFDLAEVSLAAVRAVIEIAIGEPGVQDADVRVLRLRNDVGQRILPEWRGYRVTPHAACASCTAR